MSETSAKSPSTRITLRALLEIRMGVGRRRTGAARSVRSVPRFIVLHRRIASDKYTQDPAIGARMAEPRSFVHRASEAQLFEVFFHFLGA
jgi:hypothetical protein